VLSVVGCVWHVEICLLGRLGGLEGLGSCFFACTENKFRILNCVLCVHVEYVLVNISEGLVVIFCAVCGGVFGSCVGTVVDNQ